MKDILPTLVAMIQLLPNIITLILQIEQIIGPGKGDVKKAIIMGAVPPNAELEARVSSVIDKSVAKLNEAGALQKETN